ncbi:hypothetical protein OKA05_13850 [Luteolibacter arcticus]|uniref:Uncharacterized protein n=1 Tax=Luteolibacter arcticus TaxID=1581411 RepID=A0ABT3GJE7_9BACT|nr:hypothetical protein [Luteolibacter arcticus]MCW1923644.1 hypothetical protein [Luteolibacter arcticus]
MRTTTFTTVGAVGLVDWLKHSTPRFSLAIGANCGCDISRLGREVCEYLNRPGVLADGHCRAFDAEEIRQLAGDPFWRQSVLAAAAKQGITEDFRCDFEAMTRDIAAFGGAVLSGETAIEATADLGNVFRVSLSHCDRCCPQTELILDPDGFTNEGLAAVIAKRFARWCEEKVTPRRPRTPAGSLDTVFA